MDIQAMNTRERAFSVAVLVIGFVISAAFVSSITSSMTRLSIISVKQQSQFSLLRRYLLHQGVSTKLAVRVTRNARYAVRQQEQRMAEAEVELLHLLSEPLMIELHFEVYSRVLMHSPLLGFYIATNPAVMRKLCHKAVSVLLISKGDILFSTGERPAHPRMLFVMVGQLRYVHEVMLAKEVGVSSCLCEMVLWTKWVHKGVLRAATECSILALDAAKFQEITVHFFKLEEMLHPAWYAAFAVERLNEMDKDHLSDLDMDFGLPPAFRLERGSLQSLRSSLPLSGTSTTSVVPWTRLSV